MNKKFLWLILLILPGGIFYCFFNVSGLEYALKAVSIISCISFGVSCLMIYKLILERKEIELKISKEILVLAGGIVFIILILYLLSILALSLLPILFILVLIYTFFPVFKKRHKI